MAGFSSAEDISSALFSANARKSALTRLLKKPQKESISIQGSIFLTKNNKDIIAMKNSIKKLISLILAAVLCVGCFMGGISVSAQEDTDVMENSFDFAVKTAEIIKNNESSMLRIMGKLRHASAVSDFPYSTDCVISDDGRFVMQFSTEKDLLDCLEKLQNNPDVIYAERDVPVYTGTISESAKTLSWGVKAIEADIYSQKLTPSSGNSVVVA